MRQCVGKLIVTAFAVFALAFAAGATTEQILLGQSSSGNLTFTPTGGGNVSLTLGTGIGGTASGTGALSALSGNYSITGGPVALSLVNSSAPFASYNAIGVLNFQITSGVTDLLSGTLTLVNLGENGSQASTNNTLVGDLNVTGGTDASLFLSSETGTNQLFISLGTGVFLPTLTGADTASITNGYIDPTPEPASMLLFGSGLLALAGILRRRRV